MDKFHNNKIYRVKEKIDRQGKCVYQVQACANLFESIFGIWSDYSKENETIESAIEQIQFIDKYKLKTEKVVYKETVK
jgi:hypothetical protein